jgi:hypothetical protein
MDVPYASAKHMGRLGARGDVWLNRRLEAVA